MTEVLAYLLKNNLINGNNMTVTGRTLGENLDRWTHEHGELEFSRQDVIQPLEKPIKETGHLRYEPSSYTHMIYRRWRGSLMNLVRQNPQG